MSFNPFNKPPLNKIFTNGSGRTLENPAPESSSNEKAPGSNIAWKKFLTFFLVGNLSIQAVEAASMSMTIEEKKDAIEYMKSSPEINKAYEQKLLEIAKKEHAVQKGIIDGKENTIKTFRVDAETAVAIEYIGEEAITISVKDIDPSGAYKILVDGSEGDKLDGKVDHILTTDSKGNKIKYGFVEKINEKGETVAELKGISLSEGGASLAFVNAQKAFQEKLENAVK